MNMILRSKNTFNGEPRLRSMNEISKSFLNDSSSMRNAQFSCDKYNMNSSAFDNYMHKSCSFLVNQANIEGKNSTNMVVCEAAIDFHVEFTKYLKNGTIDIDYYDIWCGYYDINMEYHDEYLMTFLHKNIEDGKTIFVYFDLENYCLEKEKNNNNSQTCHSTALVFMPTEHKLNGYGIKERFARYSMFYFNSHGQVLCDVHKYSYYISKKRSKDIELNMPIDIYILEKFVDLFNNSIQEYSDFPVVLDYEKKTTFNYFGSNLQVGDSIGVCFVYPFILWYELFYNSYRTEMFGKVKCPSYRRMMQNKQWNMLIYYMLQNYVTEIKFHMNDLIEDCSGCLRMHPQQSIESVEKSYEEIEGIIENLDKYFIRNLYIIVIQFLSQKYISDKHENKIN